MLWAREALPGPDERASLVSVVTPEWIPKLESGMTPITGWTGETEVRESRDRPKAPGLSLSHRLPESPLILYRLLRTRGLHEDVGLGDPPTDGQGGPWSQPGRDS